MPISRVCVLGITLLLVVGTAYLAVRDGQWMVLGVLTGFYAAVGPPAYFLAGWAERRWGPLSAASALRVGLGVWLLCLLLLGIPAV